MAIITAFSMMGVFFLIGLYVAGALGVLSLVMMQAFSDAPLWNILGNKAWESNTNFILVAVPLFLLMGELMLRSGMGERMYGALSRWLVFLPGGLLHTNIASCAVFAACSGSSVATSATISRVSLPSFRQRGYSERLVIGSLAAGGTLGILIPPSIGLIIFGVLVEESIGRLYMGGFIPGFLLAFTMMLMMIVTSVIIPRTAPMDEGVRRLYRAWFNGLGIRRYTSEQLAVLRQEQATEAGIADPFERSAYRRGRSTLSYGESISEWGRMLFEALIGMMSIVPVLAIIMMVLGSIYTGWATPTEAAALGVFGALIVAVANELYRKISNNKAAVIVVGIFLFPVVVFALDDYVQQQRGRLRGFASTLVFLGFIFFPAWYLAVYIIGSQGQLPQATYATWNDARRAVQGMLLDAIISTVRTSSMIMLIVMAAFTLSFAFARLGISQDISEWITGLNLNALQFVIILVFFYLLLGTFMESFAMLVTTIPILAPTLEAVGVDLVWFGIIMVILVEAALISPPEGINLYILHGVRQDVDQQMAEQTAAAQAALKESTITDVYIGVLPFMGCMALVIALLFVFPDIALWAPCIIYDDPSRDYLQSINIERDAAGFWESVKYCSSEFRPRAYQ
ncbi:MAG: TRAP transporter large permease [Chloroflexi bacterium]|nr:TRAP transporter large permease [Chloroflexota bacterium]